MSSTVSQSARVKGQKTELELTQSVRTNNLQFIGEDIDRAAGVEKFANSLQNTGESGSTPKEKPAFSRMVEHEKAGQYT